VTTVDDRGDPPGDEEPAGDGEPESDQEHTGDAEPDRSDAWIAEFGDPHACYTRSDLFDAAYTSLAATLEADPRAPDVVGRLVDRRPPGPADNWLGEVTDGLRDYLGTDGAFLLHWLAFGETAMRLDGVAEFAPPAVTMFLRAVLAEHGSSLDYVQRVATSGLDDWQRVNKRAYYDMLTGKMTFTVRIVKMDGETVFLQSNADSLMALTTHLLELVNAPKDLNVFSPQIVGPYLEQLRIATELIAEADKAGGDAPVLSGSDRLT
jgi:hypothetical protein